jgi:hypothetical protein
MSNQKHEAEVAKRLRLAKCLVCGQYRGASILNGSPVAVNCLCDGIKCTRCKKVKINRPISNYFNTGYKRITHVPYFLTMCKKCVKAHNSFLA